MWLWTLKFLKFSKSIQHHELAPFLGRGGGGGEEGGGWALLPQILIDLAEILTRGRATFSPSL